MGKQLISWKYSTINYPLWKRKMKPRLPSWTCYVYAGYQVFYHNVQVLQVEDLSKDDVIWHCNPCKYYLCSKCFQNRSAGCVSTAESVGAFFLSFAFAFGFWVWVSVLTL